MNLRALALLLLAGCGGADEAAPASDTSSAHVEAVYTTFHPTTYLAERIAGGLVPVVCPLPEGEDPIFWQPDRATLARYADARLVVVNGAGLEQWVATASLAPSRLVDSARGFEDAWMEYADARTHSHGAAGEHVHAGLDGHTWLDPLLAAEQARAILEGMCAAWPDHALAFRANHAVLAEDLAALHAELEALAPALRAANVLASHPAYNYLARRYDVAVRSFDLDPEAPLDAEAVAQLAEAARPDVRNLLLWESEPAPATRAAVPEALRSVTVSPAENPSAAELADGGDFLGVMRANVARLRAALAP